MFSSVNFRVDIHFGFGLGLSRLVLHTTIRWSDIKSTESHFITGMLLVSVKIRSRVLPATYVAH